MAKKATAKAKTEETTDRDTADLPSEGAIARLEALATELQIGDDPESIVAFATEFGVELLRRRPKPWDQMLQSEQRDVQAAIEQNMRELVRQIVEAIAREGRTAIRCLLVGFSDKGEDIKAELKVKALSMEETELAVLGLHRARGAHVLLTVASVDAYSTNKAADQSTPDQPALGFEAGADQHPADDSDLVEAADKPEFAQTGNQMLIESHGLCEIRVNLTTGMIEARAPLRDDFDIDVREATPVELAHERDRVADFEQGAGAETVPA